MSAPMAMFARGNREEPVDAWVLAQDLGELQRKVPLGGELAVAAAAVRPTLAQTDRGVWIVGVTEEGDGVAVDLLADPELRLEWGMSRGRILLAETSFEVPFGSSSRVQAAIAHGRLAAQAGPRRPVPEVDRFVQKASPLELDWLAGALDEGEYVLAWLETSTSTTFDSIVPRASGTYRYLLTDRRARLVAISDAGDVLVHELPDSPLTISNQVGRDGVAVGQHTWLTTLRNDGLYREIAGLQGLSPADRLRELARLRWLGRDRRGRGTSAALSLLGLGREQLGDATAGLAHAWVQAASTEGEGSAAERLLASEAGATALATFLRGDPGGEGMAEWAERWSLGLADATALVRGLRHGEGWLQASLPLHRWVHRQRVEAHDDPVERARIDAELAEHAIAAGQETEAALVLEARLSDLPASSLDELVAPDDDEELAAGFDAHQARIRLLELLARAREGAPRDEALAELARLGPLDGGRLEDAWRSSEGPLKERIERVRGLLRDFPRSFDVSYVAEAGAIRPLGARVIDDVLRHPATREGQSLGQLQRLLSREVDLPDYEQVRTYAELAVESRYPALMAAVTDARTLLGIEAPVEVFIQRVGSTVGVRAHEGPRPFLLVGLEHVDPGGSLFLREPELRFRVGAELAHLSLGHARLTARKLWDEVFEKAPGFLELLVQLGPMLPLKGAWQAGLQLASKVPVGRIFAGRSAAESFGELNLAWKDLLAACRLMQLTADRAGLLLADDVLAATRAIFLSSRSHLDDLAVAERHGLVIALHRRGDGHAVLPTSLALRVAALWSFYLSEDWERLRRAAREPRLRAVTADAAEAETDQPS